MSDNRDTFMYVYHGKPRPFGWRQQGQNGEVKIIKEATMVKSGPDGFIDHEKIAAMEHRQKLREARLKRQALAKKRKEEGSA